MSKISVGVAGGWKIRSPAAVVKPTVGGVLRLVFGSRFRTEQKNGARLAAGANATNESGFDQAVFLAADEEVGM